VDLGGRPHVPVSFAGEDRRQEAAVSCPHEKTVSRAFQNLAKRPNRKTFMAAVQALHAAPLASGYAALRDLVKQLAEKPPKEVTEAQCEEARAAIRASLDEE
jgi:hypothetical protein